MPQSRSRSATVFKLWPASIAALMSAQARRIWPALVTGFSDRRSRIGDRFIRENIAFRRLGLAEAARATIDNRVPHLGNRCPLRRNVWRQKASVSDNSQQGAAGDRRFRATQRRRRNIKGLHCVWAAAGEAYPSMAVTSGALLELSPAMRLQCAVSDRHECRLSTPNLVKGMKNTVVRLSEGLRDRVEKAARKSGFHQRLHPGCSRRAGVRPRGDAYGRRATSRRKPRSDRRATAPTRNSPAGPVCTDRRLREAVPHLRSRAAQGRFRTRKGEGQGQVRKATTRRC